MMGNSPPKARLGKAGETTYRIEFYSDQDGRRVRVLVPMTWRGMKTGTPEPPCQYRLEFFMTKNQSIGGNTFTTKDAVGIDVDVKSLEEAWAIFDEKAEEKHRLAAELAKKPKIARPSLVLP